MVNERISGVIKPYLLVGVKMRTYLVQWVVYCVINQAVMGGLLTLVCVYWGLMPQSSAGLIYVLNYLGLVQYYTAMIVVCQFVNQADTVRCLPCLVHSNIFFDDTFVLLTHLTIAISM